MNDERERAAFENYAADEYEGEMPLAWNEARNCYDDFATHCAFKAWKASRALPVVPNDEQKEPTCPFHGDACSPPYCIERSEPGEPEQPGSPSESLGESLGEGLGVDSAEPPSLPASRGVRGE